MTPLQLRQRAALLRCTFVPASHPKRFVRDVNALPERAVLTEKQAASLNRMAHAYRKQMGGCLAAPCEKCGTPDAPQGDRVELGTQMGLFAPRSGA